MAAAAAWPAVALVVDSSIRSFTTACTFDAVIKGGSAIHSRVLNRPSYQREAKPAGQHPAAQHRNPNHPPPPPTVAVFAAAQHRAPVGTMAPRPGLIQQQQPRDEEHCRDGARRAEHLPATQI